MKRENSLMIGILTIAVVCLLFLQGRDTHSKLSKIEFAADRILDQFDAAKSTDQRQLNQPHARGSISDWVNDQASDQVRDRVPVQYTKATLAVDPVQDWGSTVTEPSETEWGRKLEKRIADLETASNRVDDLDSRLKKLEQLFVDGLFPSKSVSKSATKLELLSVDDQSPLPVQPIIVQSAPAVFSQPVYYSSVQSYGSTGSAGPAVLSLSYGSLGGAYTQSYQANPQSFQANPQSFSQSSRIVRRPVQQIQATSYGPVMGTRLGSRLGNFFGQDCPGGVCPR